MSQTEVIILREFLAADAGLVSGARLAQLLGVSRVAVWMQLQKFSRQGFTFEAVQSRGYRLRQTPDQLHLALVQAHLGGRPRRPALSRSQGPALSPSKGPALSSSKGPALSLSQGPALSLSKGPALSLSKGPALSLSKGSPHIICLDTVDSTNSEAERQLAADGPVPLVILARAQTRGRGRRGRVWHSPAAGNLYCTFVFRPRLEPAQLQGFTLWMGLNLCELVANFCKIAPGLKWPNDLYLGDRKAGGMLTEARIDADQIRDLVFGLGLNLNGRARDLPPDLASTATSLAEATGAPLDLNRFAAALIGRVLAAYDQFIAGDYRDKFADLWKQYDLLRGRSVTVTQGTRIVAGTATGIDDEGSLIVRLNSGPTERFRAGEVTLSPLAAPVL